MYNTDPAKISDRNERLAFWINAYNAYTLKVICNNYPVESIKDLSTGGNILSYILKTTVWDKAYVNINKKVMSLNDIEHGIIRKVFREPRIHFALVCAAISCPPLRNEPYTGQKLDHQLSEQAKIFFSDKSKNYFDLINHTAYLSKILSWYDGDFGNNEKQVLNKIAAYFPKEIAENIKKNPGKWELEYNDYNWSLNKQ